MVAPVPPSPITGNAPLDGWFTLLRKRLLGTASDLTSLSGSLSTVATSGDYADLSGKPTIPTIDTGTWTPTLSNTTNVAASTAYACNYLRVNDTVICSGVVNIDPTTGLVATLLGISLPVASDFTTVYQCRGTANSAGAGDHAEILADATNNRASLSWYPPDGVARNLSFIFMYRVV